MSPTIKIKDCLSRSSNKFSVSSCLVRPYLVARITHNRHFRCQSHEIKVPQGLRTTGSSLEIFFPIFPPFWHCTAGDWVGWTSWSACSASCGGGGTMIRSNICLKSEGNDGVQLCTGSTVYPTIERQPCSLDKTCPGKLNLYSLCFSCLHFLPWPKELKQPRCSRSTAHCSEIGSLTSLDACKSGASSDVSEPTSLI